MVYVSYVAARRAVAAADYLLVPLTLQVRIWAWAPGTGEAAETGVWSQQACISLSSPGTAVVSVVVAVHALSLISPAPRTRDEWRTGESDVDLGFVEPMCLIWL